MLSKALREIRAYTEADPLLRTSHFRYDLRIGGSGPCEVALMGLNPGESELDRSREFRREESSEYDFRQQLDYANKFGKRPSYEERRYEINARKLIGKNVTFVETEFFLWSTPDVPALKEKFRSKRFNELPHLDFCTRLNKLLIKAHNPNYVVVSGISQTTLISKYFDLKQVETFSAQEKRLAVLCECNNRRRWFFVPHLTGARGISDLDREKIAKFILRRTRLSEPQRAS